MLTLTPKHISRRVALQAFDALSERWRLPRKDWPAILHKSESTIYAWLREAKEGHPHAETPLDADVAERLSHLLSIYNGLHILFGDARFADEWIYANNQAFGGQPPVRLLKSGAFEDLLAVRKYIDRANSL